MIMKKFFTQQINFAYAMIIMLILVVSIGQAAAVSQSTGYAIPGESPIPIIHKGGGEQAISTLRLGACIGLGDPCGPIGALDTRGPAGAVTLFDSTLTGGTFSILDDFVVLQNLYISDDVQTALTGWLSPQGPSSITLPELQKVNVDGDVLATNLQNTPSGPGATKPVCATTNGTIEICPDLIGGSCGLSAGQNFSSPPNISLCSAGTASSVTTNTSTYDWTCTGTGGTANCQANRIIPVNASCGAAAGHNYSNPPTNGLCAVGNPGSVTTNSSTYDWFCYGTGGGTNLACQANRTIAINGQCRPFNSGPYATQPANSSNGCIAGVYNDLSEGAGSPPPWKWECNGTGGGSDDTCFADAAPSGNPSCAVWPDTYPSQPATSSANGCDVGTYADFTDNSTNWRWTCTDNGITNTCSALKEDYDGYGFVCGTDPNGPFGGAGQSAPVNSRWSQWTRGTGYFPDGNGDEDPFTLGSYDCLSPTTLPSPHSLPNGTTGLPHDGFDSQMVNPNGQGDLLYWKYYCLDAAPDHCFCETVGTNEPVC